MFFLEGDYWMINFGHESGSGNAQLAGTKVSDNQWHTLTATINQVDANTRNVYVFTDGVRSASPINIASRGNLNSPRPFNVGNLISSNGEINADYFVTDIRFYNTALPDAYIQANYCRTDIPEDGYKTNLMGFWPSNVVEPDGKTIKDQSGGNNHLTIQSYNPGIFNDVSTKVCPPIVDAVYRSVPNSVDVAMQVYQWLGILTPPSWKLDGKTWVPQYINVR
ncbi:DUF4983 domain-containing protein [Niabella ginsengisoli]|uniref:DUF4983 domain-containing protein n=1 Tax=Niabella ginsengisoli TaxID=522298 RepID=A0ABS9SG00_9BACT|nr:DUF4983 domain-containing protein [Niabella ginsengisoli]MCH5597297.1 DUF4983 domain-containing protein [Niabella ginsengisoli]